MNTPLYPLEGVVSWNMNTSCNYRCSYCTQRASDDRGAWAEDIDRFLAAFAALPGDWEIKLSGGEPFQHPAFLDVVRGLSELGLRVSVVTNLSSPDPVLEEYCRITETRPGLISASLHLEYADPSSFRDRCAWLSGLHRGPLSATCVATKTSLPSLRSLVEDFAAAGIRLQIQPEKVDREVVHYTEEEQALLLALGGHAGTGRVAPSFEGRACWAGARYFVVDHLGQAYRCYPARRWRAEYLGNLLDGSFRPRLEAAVCRYSYCNCVVPQARGMVSSKEDECSPGA